MAKHGCPMEGKMAGAMKSPMLGKMPLAKVTGKKPSGGRKTTGK